MTIVATHAGPEHPENAPAHIGGRSRLRRLLPYLIVLLGVLIMAYPVVVTQLRNHGQLEAADSYRSEADELSEAEREAILADARAYNETETGAPILDPWLARVSKQNVPYQNYLETLRSPKSTAKNPAIAVLTIPAIDLKLPVFHGTEPQQLAEGVGHLYGSALPVGGEGMHSVLTAHTGYPTATLFDNLNKVKEDDTFFIETFGETLKYQVHQIEVVLPGETDSLLPQRGKDLVTLITCTPYGVNTHRILVHAHRVPFTPADQAALDNASGTIWQWWMAIVIALILLVLAALYWLIRRWRKRMQEAEAAAALTEPEQAQSSEEGSLGDAADSGKGRGAKRPRDGWFGGSAHVVLALATAAATAAGALGAFQEAGFGPALAQAGTLGAGEVPARVVLAQAAVADEVASAGAIDASRRGSMTVQLAAENPHNDEHHVTVAGQTIVLERLTGFDVTDYRDQERLSRLKLKDICSDRLDGQIEKVAQKVTGASGAVTFEGLAPAAYLVSGETSGGEELFPRWVVLVPRLVSGRDGESAWNYNVTVNPKALITPETPSPKNSPEVPFPIATGNPEHPDELSGVARPAPQAARTTDVPAPEATKGHPGGQAAGLPGTRSLAQTGASVIGLVLAVLALILIGMWLRRRRDDQEDQDHQHSSTQASKGDHS